MAILNATALELVQEAATAANADILAGTYNGIRLALEDLLVRLAFTGASGTLTSDPPNDTTGVLTDSGAGFSADAHNGRQVVICSGTTIGNIYTIADTTGTTLAMSGSPNLYADGLRSGDAYKVLYQFSSCAAHLHDGVNGALVPPPPAFEGYHRIGTWTANYTNSLGQAGPTGYSYHRIAAWKTGRAGRFWLRHTLATGSAGGCTFRGIIAINGSPVAATYMEQWIAAGSSYTSDFLSTGAVNAGDLIEVYADTTATATGCTWMAELLVWKPAFTPVPLLSERL